MTPRPRRGGIPFHPLLKVLERIADALEANNKPWVDHGIIEQPIRQQTFWNCEKCMQLHLDMEVGDCFCDCHKVMS
jgi:hypothetical protein